MPDTSPLLELIDFRKIKRENDEPTIKRQPFQLITNVNSTGGASNDSRYRDFSDYSNLSNSSLFAPISSSSQRHGNESADGQRTHRLGRPNTNDLASSSSQRVRGSGGCGSASHCNETYGVTGYSNGLASSSSQRVRESGGSETNMKSQDDNYVLDYTAAVAITSKYLTNNRQRVALFTFM